MHFHPVETEASLLLVLPGEGWCANRDRNRKCMARRLMSAHKLGKLWKFKATEIDQWIRAGRAREDATEK